MWMQTPINANSDTVLLGPWGGEGGNPWSYTIIGTLSYIYLTRDGTNGVNSIRFTSIDKNGIHHESGLFGVESGKEKEVKIYDNDRLICIEGTVGTYNSVRRVTQLGFTTIKNVHGLVGCSRIDSNFSCLLSNDTITGFHGRSGTVLNSLGVSVEVKPLELAGPWPAASDDGNSWDYTSKGPIWRISITYDDIIHSLEFTSRIKLISRADVFHPIDRPLQKSSVIGRADGTKPFEIEIDPKVENIIGLTGAYGPYAGTTVVKSLTFMTNKSRSFGPFGTQKDGDTPFSFSVQDPNLLSGFHGRAGSLIYSIGVLIKPTKIGAKVGPFSATNGGLPWDYQPKGLISRIFVTHAETFRTIQFESVEGNGEKQTSDVFGEDPGPNRFTIDIESDKLTNLSGAIGDFGGGKLCISGLYISTEKKVYGPFGSVKQGIKFSFAVKDGYISGFHGQSSKPLHAIGVYVKPC